MSLTAIRERAALRAIRLAPKQLYSTLVDWSARRTIPRSLRGPLYVTYSRLVGADLREVELPLSSYDSFGEFFARRLRAGAREASTDMTAAASPCDGRVGAFGEITDGCSLQAKGRSYSLGDLLANADLADQLDGGTQVTIYLSPADYHRVHAPVSGRLVGYTYIPGERYPVGPFFAERIDGLFSENERLVIELETDDGPMAVVLVGALGVGNLCLTKPRVSSRDLSKGGPHVRKVKLDPPLAIARGEELGAFHLGSTVVVVFPRGVFQAKNLRHGQRIECGQSFGKLGGSRGWVAR